ncbi:PxKF domain-containing protein, partial [Patescibacteria group bacterium]|nr:PxKF domain-containing protein [Patescibacteria group bacterium]
SITATVPNGTAIDTAMVGAKTFSVNATDNAGNQANKIVDYNAVYNYSGVLPPIKDSKDAFKLGSTIPVKFQLRDADGDYVSTAIAKIYLAKITDGIAGSEINGTSSGKANTGNLFRYAAADNQYIFNLASKPLIKGTWQIRIELDDGTSKYAALVLK